MAMRLSGLMSGMDTESIIAQMVEAKKTKVTKAVKAQKSLKYKQDAWKTLNTQIMGLYNKSLSTMRFQSAYMKKTTKVSNSSVVSVITGENAMNGVQSLKVEKLAKSAFLTGSKVGKVVDEFGDEKNATGSNTLGDLGLAEGGVGYINVSLENGKTSRIAVNSNTTINDFVGKLRDAGINANFDENNSRFYITGKTSGSEGNFDISSNDIVGLDALQALGLDYGISNVDNSKREDVIGLRETALLESLKKERSGLLNERDAMMEKLKKYASQLEAAEDEDGNKYLADLKDKDGNPVKVEDLTVDDLTEENLKLLDKAMIEICNAEGTSEEMENDLRGWMFEWDDNKKALDEVNGQLVIDANGDVQDLSADAKKKIADKVDAVLTRPTGDELEALKKRKTEGTDAVIYLNGERYESSKNSFEINGLTLTVNSTTAENEEVTITTQDDTDGVYDLIKGFLKDYNALINQMDKLYNADSAKGYEPLTDEEKEAMSESQIEEWEGKIKDSILRKDGSLNTIASAMKRIMMEGVVVNGEKMYLSNFGIGTLNYFTAAENEKNAYHIDGDPDDEHTSGNADKLKSMIANDPDTVVAFFTKLTENLRSEMFDIMKGTDYSSAFTAYDDKKMQKEYDEYTTKIKELEDKLADYEDKWYAKFAAMETALAKMQNNASAVTSLLGG
ncbi:hypothetical protein D7X48_11245 [bacterium D16-50]|jgi:flagellar hook-associated protein 2|nr:flagellar filament capping protein FliD [Lachnospiraceae bacterium]RKJ19914.1 hypothetical protein D7X48_11245 [bacterium D16-50]